MEKLTNQVEIKIRHRIPEHFALVFDGWSHGDNHYVGIYASFTSKDDI